MNIDPSFTKSRILIRAFGGKLGLAIDRRVFLTCVILLSMAVMVLLAALASGQLRLPMSDVLGVLSGGGERRTRMVVLDWRMPRAMAAILLGGMLGLGGAVFQSITRNPLGSPDVVGFDAGAYTGAILAITFLGGGWLVLAGSAVAGGLLTALVVYALTWQQGIRGFQLIIVGIGVSAMLTATNQWILMKVKFSTAVAANNWNMGSLAKVSGDQLLLLLWVALPVVIATLWLARPLNLMEMGESRAKSLGVQVEKTRLALIVLGITATALVTAIAGPIPFIALAAPQIAHVVSRSPGTTLSGSMAMGALLLLVADYIAQHAFPPVQLPVGVVTLCIGGIYFLWLILKEARRA